LPCDEIEWLTDCNIHHKDIENSAEHMSLTPENVIRMKITYFTAGASADRLTVANPAARTAVA
jgi:hypothetical protein